MLNEITEIVSYRCMIHNLVKRDIRGRYKGSVLGFFWNIILPLVQILVYIMVFTQLFNPSMDNYALYLTTGMIIWIWFSETLIESSGTMVINSDMLKKIYFPRSVLPISVLLSKTVTFLITLVVLFAIIVVTDFGFSWNLLFLPIAMLIMMVFMLGLSLILSSLNAYFRDIQYIVAALMMAWIWMTPIMYAKESISMELMSFILTVNPLTYMFEMFQDILFWKTFPSIELLLICISIAIGTLIVGIVVFRRLERDFAEVL